MKKRYYIKTILLLSLAILALLTSGFQPQIGQATTQSSAPNRRVNVPHLMSGGTFTSAVFCFGKVSPTSNYADVRLWYYDEQLAVVVNIIDRLVWYDTTPTGPDLTNWDAVSLYIDMDGNAGSVRSENAHLFQSQSVTSGGSPGCSGSAVS